MFPSQNEHKSLEFHEMILMCGENDIHNKC